MNMEISHLYCIVFPNGKRYFGVTKNPKRRWTAHKNAAKRGETKQLVHKALRKYPDAVFNILVIGPEPYIFELERKAIAAYQTRDTSLGYNQAPGGETSPVAGIGHSLESRRKMSLSQKERKILPGERDAFIHSAKGRITSPDHRQRLKEAALARWSRVEADSRLWPDTRERLDVVRKMLGDNRSRKDIAATLNLSKTRTAKLVHMVRGS